MANPTRQWTVKDSAALGVVSSILVGMFTIAVSVSTGQWLWAILTVPMMVTLCVVAGLIVQVGARSAVVVRVAKVAGLLLAAGAGVALVWFGISVNLDAATCDPAVSRCVSVVNGVARGKSTESVDSQQFEHLLLSLVVIIPGLVILYFTSRGAISFTRQLAGRHGKA